MIARNRRKNAPDSGPKRGVLLQSIFNAGSTVRESHDARLTQRPLGG
jgi:hypothetical protein